MKICIVTVYNSENFGSFLQAYTLSLKLKEMGHTVSFYERKAKGTSHSPVLLILRTIKYLLNLKFADIKILYQRYNIFENEIKAFPITKDFDLNLNSIDLFIIGSDTVWNADSKSIEKMHNVFWGSRFKGFKVATYAASIANTKLEYLKKLKYPKECLEDFFAISIRDNYTKKTINQLTDKPLHMVCDPTMLFCKEQYQQMQGICDYENFILVYIFDDITNEMQVRFREFAISKNMKLIAVGKVLNWCDESIIISPTNFIAFFDKASYVITDTFHGTIFSIVYNKKFVAIERNKQKVKALLDSFNLSHHLSEQNELCKIILEKEIDYISIENDIANLRNNSILYLSNLTDSKIG